MQFGEVVVHHRGGRGRIERLALPPRREQRRSRGCLGHRAALLHGGGVMDVIRHAGIGLDAAQQPHAGVQVVVHLAFVIAALALALGEDHIGHAGGVHIHQVLHIVGGHPVHAEFHGGLVDDLIHQTVDLLAIVGRSLGVTRAETLARRAVGVSGQAAVQILGLGLPHHTPVACDLPGGLLIHHGAFEPAQRGVHLADDVAALAQVERHVLDVLLRQLGVFAVIQRVGTFEELIHLFGVIPPFALARPGDARSVPAGFRLLRHGS